MSPIKIKLSPKDLARIKERLKEKLIESRIVKRAHTLKLKHMGKSTKEISSLLDFDPKSITNTVSNYLQFGLERALTDDPRSGRPILFDARDTANIVAMVCTDPPEGFARWTLDLIAEESVNRDLVDSISTSKVQVILQEHDLKPWREKMWCIPTLNDEYIERMEDVLKVYERKYNPKKPVVCIDEKPVALIADKYERVPGMPGEVGKKDYEYTRNGSVNVFCAVEPLKGKYINRVTPNRKGPEFAKFIRDLSRKYSDADKIVLIMDNLSSHGPKSLTNYYGITEGERIWDRFEVHYTPKHASWLNQAEIAIGMYSRQSLGDGRVGDYQTLTRITKHWNKATNKKGTIIQWKFNRLKAREKFGYDIGIN